METTDNPFVWRIVQGAISGLIGAMLVDYNAFRSWKSVNHVTAYDWRTAGLRWVQGIVAGALGAVGLGAAVA